MTDRTTQDDRYWLTPMGCVAAGGHHPNSTGMACNTCGAILRDRSDREDSSPAMSQTAQPIPTPEQPDPDQNTRSIFAVTPLADSRLSALHAQYADAKAAADAAAERLKTITDGIKAELRAQADGTAYDGTDRSRIELRSPYGPILRLTKSERVTFDSRKLKVDDPVTYVKYAKFGEAWALRVIETVGGEG